MNEWIQIWTIFFRMWTTTSTVCEKVLKAHSLTARRQWNGREKTQLMNAVALISPLHFVLLVFISGFQTNYLFILMPLKRLSFAITPVAPNYNVCWRDKLWLFPFILYPLVFFSIFVSWLWQQLQYQIMQLQVTENWNEIKKEERCSNSYFALNLQP